MTRARISKQSPTTSTILGAYRPAGLIQARYQEYTEIDGPSIRFRLVCSLAVRVENQDGLVALDCPEFNILSYGTNMEAAQQSFFEDFEIAWGQYSTSADSELTLDARAIKRKLQALVVQVE